jgi:hypothetical protein
VRVIRVRLKQAGFRTRTVVLVTTRLDPVAYPAEEVAAAYLRRWRTELGLDALKIVLSLEAPRGKSPAMIRRGRFALLVAPNPVCAVRASAAHEQAGGPGPPEFRGLARRAAQLRRLERASDQAAQRRRVWPGLPARLAGRSCPAAPRPARTARGQTSTQVRSPP